jgi:hypothetical protein
MTARRVALAAVLSIPVGYLTGAVLGLLTRARTLPPAS